MSKNYLKNYSGFLERENGEKQRDTVPRRITGNKLIISKRNQL